MSTEITSPVSDDAVDTPVRAMLTTVDNPYSPFTHFDEWFAFDTIHGYNTCGLLDRIAFTSDELSEADQKRAIEVAMDEIIQVNASGMHKKVYKSH